MHVLHVPYCYWPDAVGGTEVYVRRLVRELRHRGVPSVVAAPAASSSQERIDDAWVFRYGIGASDDIEHSYGAPDPQVGEAFARVLEELEPEIVHFHAWSRGVSQACSDGARATGAKVVWSYHTPTVSCPRGTLLKDGTTVCDGTFTPQECARCVMSDQIGFDVVARAAAAIPASLSEQALRLAPSKARTAMAMRHLLTTRERAWKASVGSADRVIAVCNWADRVLRVNGIDPDRVRLCRHGVDPAFGPLESIAARRARLGPLRVVFLGRAHHDKGLDVLLEAVERARDAALTLDLYLSIQDESGQALVATARAATAGDTRIRWFEAIPPERVPAVLAEADIVAVPSQVLETGPLVVLESFAVGTPVIGSRLGGIEEMVRDGVNGLLVQHDDVEAWVKTIERLASRRDYAASLSANVRPPRTMADVAAEHEAIYRELVPE